MSNQTSLSICIQSHLIFCSLNASSPPAAIIIISNVEQMPTRKNNMTRFFLVRLRLWYGKTLSQTTKLRKTIITRAYQKKLLKSHELFKRSVWEEGTEEEVPCWLKTEVKTFLWMNYSMPNH